MPSAPGAASGLNPVVAFLSSASFNPNADGLVIFANELAVGAKSLEEILAGSFTGDDDRTAVPSTFLEPILLTVVLVMVPDNLLEDADDIRVPIDDIPPLLDVLVPIFELVLLALVPDVPVRLFLVDVDGVGSKGGIGDLAWDGGEKRREVVLFLIDGFTAAEDLEVTGGTAFFGAGTAGGGTVFFTLLGATLGAVLDEAAAFPRPKTLCTRDLAEDRNPNLAGLGWGLTTNMSFNIYRT